MKWFITGEPRVGKTTLIILLIERLKREGINYDGIITKEIRENNERIGFQIIDLKTNVRGILAAKKLKIQGPRLGSYIINLEDLEMVGIEALERAYKNSDLIICDEIGAMELTSSRFRILIEKIIKSNKPLLSTLHRKYLHYSNLATNKKLIFLTRENWGQVFQELSEEIVNYFKRKP